MAKSGFTPNPYAEQYVLRQLQAGILNMASDIKRQAVDNAPVLTGNLIKSGKITPTADGVEVSFGSPAVPYANRRHWENNRHPGTRLYLQRAAQQVASGDITKYFRGLI